MAKKQSKASKPTMVMVECKASVKYLGRYHKPETVIEVPVELADELEDGGFAERVFDVVVPSTAPAVSGGDTKGISNSEGGNSEGGNSEGGDAVAPGTGATESSNANGDAAAPGTGNADAPGTGSTEG